MKKLYLSIISVLIIINVNAQWQHQFGSLQQGNWIQDIYFTDSDTGYASDNYYYLLKTTDGGLTWDSISDWGGSYIGYINFITPSIGIGVGAQGAIVKTTDGGLNWTLMTSGVTTHLAAIDCVAPDTFFVAGENVVLKSDDAGITWQTIYSGAGFYSGIDFINSQIGYVASNNGIIKTIDGGSSWTTVSTESNNKISCITENICFAMPQGDSLIRKTIDGGTTWTDLPFNANLFLMDIQALTEDIVFVACTTMFELTVLKTLDGGATWYLQEQVNDTLGGVTIFMLDENNGWYGGYGGIFKTANGGGPGSIISSIQKENNNSQINIYPNPTTGVISITNKGLEIRDIEVFDIYGEKVLKTEVGSQKTEVDLSTQAKGIYIIKVRTGKGVAVEKVVLE